MPTNYARNATTNDAHLPTSLRRVPGIASEPMSFNRFGPADAEILASETLHSGFLGLERHQVRHRLFAGGWSGARGFEVVRQRASAAVLPYDPRRDAVVLIEQFRLPALLAEREPWQIEAVAGLLDQEGEPAEEVARREAREEAGLEVTALRPVAALLSSAGASTELIHHFVGRVDTEGVDGLHGLAEEQEDIRPQVLSFDAAWALLEGGAIGTAFTWICLAWLKLNRDELRRSWG